MLMLDIRASLPCISSYQAVRIAVVIKEEHAHFHAIEHSCESEMRLASFMAEMNGLEAMTGMVC